MKRMLQYIHQILTFNLQNNISHTILYNFLNNSIQTIFRFILN